MKIQKAFREKMLLVLVMLSLSITIQAQIKVGDALPNSTIRNTQNEEVNLSSFKGKIVLIDFWVSWCGPCRIGNKKLVKLYNQFDNAAFEIIGISIDTDPKKWISAIEKDKIKYTQLIDPKGFDAKTAVLFNVEQLPSSFLFDKSGFLIAINPTEEDIDNYYLKK
jgi:peroxiredoxin